MRRLTPNTLQPIGRGSFYDETLMQRLSIRLKMWAALACLFLLVFILAGAGLYALRLYTNQVRDITWRVNILPVAEKLNAHVSELRAVQSELRGLRNVPFRLSPLDGSKDRIRLEGAFSRSLFSFAQTAREYHRQLEERLAEIGDASTFEGEASTVQDIRRCLASLKETVSPAYWAVDEKILESVDEQILRLQQLCATLPTYLHEEFQRYSQTTKIRSSWLMTTVFVCVFISVVLMILLIVLSYSWIFRPLGILIKGSRKVAEGTFQYRIELSTHDEMAELAESMNSMTERFEKIRHDLDEQVQQRSRELIRSERLASVGFLAAGVAHEINNPLAAISTCAESLQRRIVPILLEATGETDETGMTRRYLTMIQEEAFRCKGITENLLNFARSEKSSRELTDLVPLVTDLVELAHQHRDFRKKNVLLKLPDSLFLTANPQEMKQVILNLVANAFHNTDDEGHVTISLYQDQGKAFLSVIDDGFGMDEETLKNVFEPFFTRRVKGRGTGLGLSISHRIIEDHHGRLEAFSDGPGRGATFTIELPCEG